MPTLDPRQAVAVALSRVACQERAPLRWPGLLRRKHLHWRHAAERCFQNLRMQSGESARQQRCRRLPAAPRTHFARRSVLQDKVTL